MNIRFKSRYLALALSLCVFFSCKKDDAPGTPTPEQKPTLFETVQGKWVAPVTLEPRVSNVSVLGAPKASMKVEDMGAIASIEFLKDSSCLIVAESGLALYHKIGVKDSTTFTFGQVFDDLSEIKVEGDSISFNVVQGDEVVTVKAGKVADLTLPQDRKSLVNDWLVTHEEDGDSLYNAGNNNNGPNYPDGTQIYFQLTPAGSFVYKITYGSQAMVVASTWELDPDHSDILKIASFNYNDNNDLPESFVRILSLTETSAKIQLVSYMYNDNNNVNNSGKVSGEPDIEEHTATLVLAKK